MLKCSQMALEQGISPISADIPDIAGLIQTDELLANLQIARHELVSGGFAHHVFRLNVGSETLYLKHRGKRFARVPEITCNPDDIDYEGRALSLFGHSSPGFFPEILQHDRERHYLVITDVLGNGQTLEQILILGQSNPIMINQLGNALRSVHSASEHIIEAVRPDDDTEYYTRVLGHRFGFEENPGLNSVTEELALIPERNLILGDASPKNIGVNYHPDRNEYTFGFFDLETAHRGCQTQMKMSPP